MADKISYRGLKKLNNLEIGKIKNFAEKEFSKIIRKIPNATLKIDVKKASNTGKRSRYTVSLKIATPTKNVLNCEITKWDLDKALKEAFISIGNEATKKFRLGVIHRIKKIFS